MASVQMIELLCYLSPQVRKSAAVGNVSADFVTWRVNVSKPFEDPENYGALSQSLGIHTLCEMCDYSEGVVRDVIDTRRTPEELGFRPHMAVYLRQKRGPGRGDASGQRIGSVTLTAQEEASLNRLREITRASLTPDQPCALCGRIADDTSPSKAGATPKSRRRRSGATLDDSVLLSGSAKFDSFAVDDTPLPFRLTSEVGVQCGAANRIGEHLMPVSFGSAARIKSVQDSSLHGSVVDAFPAPSTLGGPTFLKHDGELTELKAERDRYKGERDQLANLLREEQRKVSELMRERQEHRCEGNEKVQSYLQQIESLQANLRDLMRGRDEVFTLLHQRRTAAAPHLADTPRPYAPFRLGIPTSEPSAVRPHDLLAKPVSAVSRQPLDVTDLQQRPREIFTAYSDEKGALGADYAVVKRPSGPATLQSLSTLAVSPSVGPQGHLDQPAGQAMLRMFSSVGEPYFVKRLVASQLKKGSNVLVLSSLDRVVTDEIEVDQLVSVQVEGEGMISLSSERNQWMLYMNPRERQRWVNWLFVLNPWLSTAENYPIPSTY